MNKHNLTYINMHPQPVKADWTDYLGAVLFAACIGAPFAAFFIIYGA